MFSREKLLLGEKFRKLLNSRVIIFGIGGVGGYVAELLVRAGIGCICIVDFDNVDITNKNRQIIALDSTIGRSKVDVMKERILDINKECYIQAINDKLTPDNIDTFHLDEYNYIVDCIDMVTSKTALIKYAHNNNLPIISAMGAGNRYDIPEFKIIDIFQTSNDGLAKVLRKNLRNAQINHHTVCCAVTKANATSREIGSISYYPAMCGCTISAYIVNKILEGNENGNECNR